MMIRPITRKEGYNLKLQETLEALEKSTKDLSKSVEESKQAETPVEESKETTVEAPKDEVEALAEEAPSEPEVKEDAGDKEVEERTETPEDAPVEKEEAPAVEETAESPVEEPTDAPVDVPDEPEEATKSVTESTDRELLLKSLDTVNLALNVIKSLSTPENRQDNMAKSVKEAPKSKLEANGGEESPETVKGADCDTKDGKKKMKKDLDDDSDDDMEESATKKSADGEDCDEDMDGKKKKHDDDKDEDDDVATKSVVTGKAVQSEDKDEVEKSAEPEESKEDIIKSFRAKVSEALDESDADIMAGPNSTRSSRLRSVLSEANKSTELTDDLKQSFLEIN